MKRYLAFSALLAFVAAGCTTYQPERDITQPMKLQKSAFEDDSVWYMHTTVIDSPYEAGFTFPGETGGYYGLNKIKWQVEENYLYAYRTYEFIKDSQMADTRDDFLGAPVAAYRIQKHFDVWHEYNPVTGEKMPRIYESTERPWWEREWMRVDWSTNHLNAFNWMFSELCKADGTIATNPISYYPNRPDDPEQFYVAVQAGDEETCEAEYDGVWVEDERSGGYCNIYGWDNIEVLDDFDYIDVVNREFVHVNIGKLFQPGGINLSCLSYPHIPLDGGMQVTYRHSFMRLEERNYEPLFMPERAFERFGFFRLEREVYDPYWGTRDIKDEFANRWNIWQAVTDESGETIRKPDREIKPIIYYYVPEERLASREACEQGREDFCVNYITDDLYYESAATWNEAFQDTLRAVGHPEAGAAEVVKARPIEYRCGPRNEDGERTLPCQNMGDVRYSHIWNHDQVFDGAPGGYGPPLVDPETGEIIAAAANVYGGYWRRYAGMMGEYYDLAKGEVTETEIYTGENIRDYFETMGGNVHPPQMPIIDFEVLSQHPTRAARGEFTTDETQLSLPELEVKRDLDEMKRSIGSDIDRRQALVGTHLERELLPPKMRWFFGVDPDATLTEEKLDMMSPFRDGNRWHTHQEEAETFFGKRFACFRDVENIFQNPNYPALFEWAEEQLAARGEEINRTNVLDFVLQRFWVHVAVHEMGHTLGLRHQFEGHFDTENFLPEYWEIQAELPTVSIGEMVGETFVSEWDLDGDGVLSEEEYNLFKEAYDERRQEQLEAGMDMYRYTSVMDYLDGLHVGIMGLGRWDAAAIKFGYGNTIELYNYNENVFSDRADEIAEAGGFDDFVFQRSNRIDVPHYLGGERCTSSDECPRSDWGVAPQKCRADRGVGRELTAGGPEDLGVCSSIWFELDEAQDNGDDPNYPDYMFCSDERVRDRPFCARGASGTSAQEMVQSAIEDYEWNYIFRNFRRYRNSTFEPFFYFNRLWGRTYAPIGNIHQSLLYNYYYTDGYIEETGPGGMLDSFLASRNGMNFFAKVLATPDIGSYIMWDSDNDLVYEGSYSELHTGWADFFVPMGIGKYLWSAFDDGYYGQLYRYARIGTFFDKLFAIEALSTRDWGYVQANDETYPLNFYDSFQDDLLHLFTSLITGDMERYAPVIRDWETDADDGRTVTSIEYRDFWSGTFMGTDTEDFRGLDAIIGEDASDRYEGLEVLNAGGSIWVQVYSLLYALFDFSAFFDNNFPSYVQLQTLSRASGANWDLIEEIKEDAENGSLVVYESLDRDTVYVSPVLPEGRSMFVPLLERANETAENVVTLRERVEEGWTEDGYFGFVDENAICGKILGLRDSDEANDRECILYVRDREVSALDRQESFLNTANEFLYFLGFTR